MPYVTVEKQYIFYAVHGQVADSPALLLIHGAGGQHVDWPRPIRQLPKTAVIALDLPGHGRSSLPGRNSVAAYASAVEAFIQALALPAVVLAGHSMGGAIAQMVGLRRLPQMRGIVLVATSARLRVGASILDNAFSHPDRAIDFILQHAWPPSSPEELVTATRHTLTDAHPEVLHADFVACHQFDLTGRLREITTPALIVSGAEDKMVPPQYGRRLAEALPNARFLLIENAGHYLMQAQPDQVAGEMRRFIATL